MTKKNKPATAKVHGISWFAQPEAPANVVSAEACWGDVPVLWNKFEQKGKIAFPAHDESNRDIARLLLKIGLELLAVQDPIPDRAAARAAILGRETKSWPYFTLQTTKALPQLRSVFIESPAEHEYIRQSGFDLYLHKVGDHELLFFDYSFFRAAISITSRDLSWSQIFAKWKIPVVAYPLEFAESSSNHLWLTP